MQFTRMPLGFKNSPAIFQRTMNIVLKDLLGSCCLVYIIDILIFGTSKQKHDTNVKQVCDFLDLYCLKENKLKRVECQEKEIF
jgi:hypothetical protein